MKLLLAGAVVGLTLLAAFSASADPTVTTTLLMPQRTIVGRLQRPTVVIVVKPESAASQAGAAHEALRQALSKQYEPATLHPAP